MLRNELFLSAQGQDSLIGTASCSRASRELGMEKLESPR